MKTVYVIWEYRKGGMRIKEIWDDAIKAQTRLLSFLDFPDPADAEYTFEEWTVKEQLCQQILESGIYVITFRLLGF